MPGYKGPKKMYLDEHTTAEDLAERLGEVFHTACRKHGDSEESQVIWDAIKNMAQDEWKMILYATVCDMFPK
jgi:hypothetical protein